MSEAAKRRQEHSPERPLSLAGYASPKFPVPLPDDAVEQSKSFGKTKKGTPVMLPPGVSSLDEWSRSILDFGKYMSKQWTYKEILANEDKEIKSYVKWCRSQVDSAEGFLRDFGMFILASEHDPAQRPLIPGTGYARRLR